MAGWTDGTFSNPVIAGFYPDPSVCRAGDDYFLACSSFEYAPGIPVFSSRDLVHWEQVGNVLRALPAGTPSSGGVYAPTLRFHDDRFWLITTEVGGSGNVLFTAADPAGPWSEPVRLPDVHGIDPDLAWDDDGNCWCTYAGIEQVCIDPASGRVLSEPCHLWSGTPGAQYPEAPHLYHIGDYWYLLIAEGGTERGHCVSVARGPAPDGPFEPCPANPVLTHRSTGRPVQSTGHADLIQGPDGSWWMVLLGVRPRGGTPGWHVLGRETFLTPVAWTADGWPRPAEVGLEMAAPPWPAAQPQAPETVREDFDDPDLHPRWVGVRSLTGDTRDRPGWLTLRARGGSLDDTDLAFAGVRQRHLECLARAEIDTALGRGGLAVRLDERHHCEVEAGDGQVSARIRIGPALQQTAARPLPAREQTGAWSPPSGQRAVLRVEMRAGGAGPDTILLGVEEADGTFDVLAEMDGRYLSTEVAGGFTGRVIGLYAAAGLVRFDWFDYQA